jgi:hypothetical protein
MIDEPRGAPDAEASMRAGGASALRPSERATHV